MHLPLLDGARGRDQRLAKHLAAEHLRRAHVATVAAEQVVLDPLEIEDLQEIRQALRTSRAQSGGATPSRSRMIGLVVVYWRNCRFSG